MRVKHILVPVLAAGLCAAAFVVVRAGVANADVHNPAAPLSVMTRNVDLGSDLGPVLKADGAAAFAHAVTEVYDEIADSNIPERADGIAAEIGQTMPLVVSLQEVSLIQRLVPTATGLTVIDQIDQLAELRAALARRGLNYTLAVNTHEFDATVPSDTGWYVRLLDQDAILTRADLPANQFSIANPRSGHFTDVVSLPTPVGSVAGTRGWASVDVTRQGTTVRVIDTHLEELSSAVGAAQATELLDGPADTTLPVVIAGDLNSGPGTTIDAYATIAASMTDTWAATKPNDPGLTWSLHGEDDLPLQTTPAIRIDMVFTRGLKPVTDTLVGTDDLTPSGLYPSDHAGVVARLAPIT
jgi:endonuclease/exonuclease/phosphatase family metal-dependent hydrolase